MTEATAKYRDTLPNGNILLEVTLPEGAYAEEARVLFRDRDMVSSDQRQKIFAICGEIAVWSGEDKERVRKVLTADFLREKIERIQMSSLSLAVGGNCDKGLASLFIDYLINFCLENEVPTSRPLQEYADDLEKYTYTALLHKRCVVCGKKADLHHVDQVGMGYSRQTKPQLGALVMPLCRVHHGEYHSIGRTAFEEKYHAVPVPMNEKIAVKYGISGKAAS